MLPPRPAAEALPLLERPVALAVIVLSGTLLLNLVFF
jgi:hypothetical protein